MMCMEADIGPGGKMLIQPRLTVGSARQLQDSFSEYLPLDLRGPPRDGGTVRGQEAITPNPTAPADGELGTEGVRS